MYLIGESLNVISKKIGTAFKERDPKPIQEEALFQKEKGMDYIDINLGPAKKDGHELMPWVVQTVQEVVPDVPLALDTSNIDAIEAALKGLLEGSLRPIEVVAVDDGSVWAVALVGEPEPAKPKTKNGNGEDDDQEDGVGGLLRYGIPDFKLHKKVIDRRMAQMRAEGVSFHANTHVGVDLPARRLLEEFDAVVLTGGAEQPRDLPIPGRELDGVHFAMDFLRSNSRRVQGDHIPEDEFISAKNKHVVVIGGGDTGSDCIGTSTRHGAASVTQLEILPRPPEQEDKGLTWPYWPNKMRTSSSQEEGCERRWSVATKEFLGNDRGDLRAVRCVEVKWQRDDAGNWQMSEVEGSEFELPAELVTLAMGFVHPVHAGMVEELGVELDNRGNVLGGTEGADAYKTSIDGVFTAGDMRRGQSLVVWAIREGRQCARAVDEYLMGVSELPR